MNIFDGLLIAGATFGAYGGWKLGFLQRLSGWFGAALGLGTALLLLPRITQASGVSSDIAILSLSAAVLFLAFTLGQGLGSALGARLRRSVDSRTARGVDAFGGAVLGVLGILVLAWLILPVMSEAKGWPAATARGSAISRWMSDSLPSPPPQITDLERQLTGSEFPQIFSGLRPAPTIVAPPEGSLVTQEQLAAAARSSVRIEATACDQIQSGSGFFVAENLIATNAHVVSGSNSVQVVSADEQEVAIGQVVAFDPEVDLALISTDLNLPPLPLATPQVGDLGLVLGFPGGGPFDPSPFVIGERIEANGFDIYDRVLVTRDLLVLGSDLAPGDSGSAVLRSDGSVVGVAVAIAPDKQGVSYALSASELSQLIDAGTAGEVDPGS
ncbi:MAG: MarP family serine protease, partial [Microthrixaceae bacterium]